MGAQAAVAAAAAAPRWWNPVQPQPLLLPADNPGQRTLRWPKQSTLPRSPLPCSSISTARLTSCVCVWVGGGGGHVYVVFLGGGGVSVMVVAGHEAHV